MTRLREAGSVDGSATSFLTGAPQTMPTTSALPTPLPPAVHAPISMHEVFNNRLVDIHVTGIPDNGGYWAVPAWRNGVPFRPASDHQLAKDDAVLNRIASDAIVPVQGSFLDAVKAAHVETRRSTLTNGKQDFTATAVLQAEDGAYYIAPLGYKGGLYGAHIDGPQLDGKTLTNVEALVPQVKAVVGGSSWVNFSGQELALDLSEPIVAS